jgi:hypothetical protein
MPPRPKPIEKIGDAAEARMRGSCVTTVDQYA